jgi:hypothetical protein
VSKVGSIWVEVRGDYSKWKEDMNVLKAEMKASGTEISNALNNSISPKQAQVAIQRLSEDLLKLSAVAKTPEASFKATSESISKALSDVAQKAGLTDKEFAKLNERMLQTQAQKGAQRALDDIAKSANLSEKEIQKLGQQMGLSNKILDEHSKGVDTGRSSWALFTAGVAASIYIFRQLATAISYLATPLKQTYQASEEFNLSVIKMASIITTFRQLKPGEDLAAAYRDSKNYANQLVEALERMAPKVFGSAQDLMMITEEFAKQGVLLDVNNKKELDAFANIANAVGVISAGYSNREMQVRQEARALMEGVVKPTNVLAGQIQKMVDGPLKEKLELWKKEGTAIENIGLLLKGYAAATGDISGTWESIKTTLETIYKVILREGLGIMYKDINEALLKMNAYLIDHRDNIITPIKEAWGSIRNIIGDIGPLLMKYVHGMEGILMMSRDILKFLNQEETIRDKQNKIAEKYQENLKKIKWYQDQISQGSASSWLNSLFGQGYDKQIEKLKADNEILLAQFKQLGYEINFAYQEPDWFSAAGTKPKLKITPPDIDTAKLQREWKKAWDAMAKDALASLTTIQTADPAMVMEKNMGELEKQMKESAKNMEEYNKAAWLSMTKEALASSKTMKDGYMVMEEEMGKLPGQIDKVTEKERQHADEVWKIERALSRDMAKFAGDETAIRIASLDAQKAAYEKYIFDKDRLDKWYNQQKTLILEDEAIKGDDFWAGMGAAMDKHYREEDKAGKLAADIFGDYISERTRAVSGFVDDFMSGQDMMVSAQKAAGEMMTNLAGDISKRMWSAAIDKIVQLIGAYISLGTAPSAAQGAMVGGVPGALSQIALYLGTAVTAMLAGKAMASKFKAEGGWVSEHPMGGWINQGSHVADDVWLGNTGNVRHWGMGGEFVVNKKAAAEYAPLLEAINKNYDAGGPIGGPEDWKNVADALVTGSGYSFLHGFYKGGLYGAIAEAIAFNATAIPSMFAGKYAGNKFMAEGGWVDVGHGFFDSLFGWLPKLPKLPFMPHIPGLPMILQPDIVTDPDKAKDMLLDIIRAPYEQVAKDLMTPGKYYSEPLSVLGNNLSNLGRITKDYFLPKFHDGTDYVPRTGLALVEEGEKIIPKDSNVPFHITLKLDGRIISDYIYTETKRGRKMVHERGVTGI